MVKYNEEYFEKKIEEVGKYVDCEQVNEALNEIKNEVEEQIEHMQSYISEYKPVIDAINVPGADLDAIVSWAEEVVDALATLFFPYIKTIRTYSETIQKYIELLNTIQQKINSLQCNIELPAAPEVPDVPTSISTSDIVDSSTLPTADDLDFSNYS